MLMTNTVLAHISCQVDILPVTSAANREQDHGAGAHSVHVTRNRTGAGLFRGANHQGEQRRGTTRHARPGGDIDYVITRVRRSSWMSRSRCYTWYEIIAGVLRD